MKNAVICLLLIAVGFLGMLAYSQDNTIREQKLSLQDLTAKLQASSTKASLDLQEKCARQARAEFKESGWEKEAMASFINHYDDELNKCFLLVTNTSPSASTPGQFLTNAILTDAFESKAFGMFMTESQKDKKYWEVKPFMCYVVAPSGEQQKCESRGEFDGMIQRYIRQNAQ